MCCLVVVVCMSGFVCALLFGGCFSSLVVFGFGLSSCLVGVVLVVVVVLVLVFCVVSCVWFVACFLVFFIENSARNRGRQSGKHGKCTKSVKTTVFGRKSPLLVKNHRFGQNCHFWHFPLPHDWC